MQSNSDRVRSQFSKDLTDVLVRVGLIAFVLIMCVRIFAPFAGLMLWAVILAVALCPLHLGLAKRLGNRHGRAAVVLVVLGLLLIGLPTAMLGSSFARHAHDAYDAFANNAIAVKQPPASVAEWPLFGKTIYSAWSSAANDLPATLEKLQPQLSEFAKYVLSLAASTAGAVLLFLGSLIIAGVMMAYGESGSQATQRILCRVAGPKKGPKLQSLSTATVRSVAIGVIGVAFIQALLLGIGFIMAGIPAAGLLALIVMLLGIMQLPATIVSLPVIAYIWWSGDSSTAVSIFFTVYLIVAGLADNVLKPLLLGRGVAVPMPVILLGALGGMVSGGIIGLFLGAVVLAVGYQIFMDWVDDGNGGQTQEANSEAAAEVSATGE